MVNKLNMLYNMSTPACIFGSGDHAEEKVAMLQSIASAYPSMQNGSSTLSSPSATCDICRICHCEAENDSPLIAPCVCAGSLRFVHQACLQQWIKSSNTRKCELCKFEFIMQTKIKPIRQWERLHMSSMERRKICCSVTFHFVAITCVVWSLYVLIDRTAEEVREGVLEWPFWTKLIVVAIGFSGGLVFMYVQCKMYWQLCQRWKAFNRIIYVQNAPPKCIITSSPNLATAQQNNNSRSTCSSTTTVTMTPVVNTAASACSTMATTTSCKVIDDTCSVTMIKETSDFMPTCTNEMKISDSQLEETLSDSTPVVPVNNESNDDPENVTVVSGSEVTMVEPIQRVID